jgi:hypothetical protein
MREEDDDRYDGLDEEPEIVPPQFPTHVAFPAPAWGAPPILGPLPEAMSEPEAEEEIEEQEGGVDEDSDEDAMKRWLRAEVEMFFSMN